MCRLIWLIGLGLTVSAAASAEDAAALYNLKVTTDNTPDVTSTEALLAEIIDPQASDEDKCMAVWEVIYLNRFWNPSSRGNLRNRIGGTDPILTLNCFAPTICQEDAEMAIALWSLLGYSTRMWQLGWHTTPEVFYGGRWRHFDPTLGVITRDEFGEVDSVTTRTDYWREEYYGQQYPWMSGSAYVSHTEPFVLGHTMGLTLRRGESLTRYWYPLSTESDYYCPGNNGARPSDRGPTDGYDKTYLEMAMELAERRFEILPYDAAYANGVWLFEPDLELPNWSDLLADSENLSVGSEDGKSYLHPAQAGLPAEAVFRIKSPYVMAGGWFTATARCGAAGDSVVVLASTDGGKTWTEYWRRDTPGQQQVQIRLHAIVNCQFDCLVKIVMTTPNGPQSVRVRDLRFETFAQNSPFVLPVLKLGQTDVTVSLGQQQERLTIVPPLDSPEYRNYIEDESNIVTAREAGQSSWVHGICAQTPGQESYLIIKVETPGDMSYLRWGGRFTDDNTNNKLYYSYDGQNWQEMPWSYSQGPENTENSNRSRVAIYEELDSLPQGTRTVWLKFWFYRSSGQSGSSLQLSTGIRIDADYAPPGQGDPPPIEITYCWSEFHGQTEVPVTHTQQISSYPTTYSITVGGTAEPIMKWLKVHQTYGSAPEPQVDAGWDVSVALPEDTVGLDGTVTDDGLPDPPGAVTVTWSCTAGPGTVMFGDIHAVDTTATFPEQGEYVLRLTADDGLYQTYDEVTISVLPASYVPEPFSRYTFDVDAADSVGGNDGTLLNGAAVVADGQRGNVLELGGVDDYVDLPKGNMASGRSELTLAMWVCPDSWTGSRTIYDEYGGDWGEYWQFSITAAKWYTRDSTTGPTGTRDNDLSMPAVPTGQWHHLAFVYSVSQALKAIYYDGELYDSTDVSVDPLTTSRAGVGIGHACDGEYFDGRIDQVEFYDVALSGEEIGVLAGKLHGLTVNNGTGDGQYEAGTVVAIAADPAPTGEQFAAWTGDVAGVDDVYAASTTITMPAANTEITATYSQVSYALTVNSGSGDGSYSAGEIVAISADPAPTSMIFKAWAGDTEAIAGVAEPDTTVTMPGADVTVTATYGWPGDLNGDGFVGQTDLDIVLDNWGLNQPPADPRADPSGDGFIGQTDLDYVLQDWGKGSQP